MAGVIYDTDAVRMSLAGHSRSQAHIRGIDMSKSSSWLFLGSTVSSASSFSEACFAPSARDAYWPGALQKRPFSRRYCVLCIQRLFIPAVPGERSVDA
jgi:hypothetical protein